MNVSIYKNTSDNLRVSKSLTLIKTLEGVHFYEESSILTPRLLLKYDEDLFVANYMYVPKFKRYFYITDIANINGNEMSITGKVDVLKTYEDEIRGSTAVVDRQEKKYNLYLNDSQFKVYNYTRTNTVPFPNGFPNEGTYVLTVAGGAS